VFNVAFNATVNDSGLAFVVNGVQFKPSNIPTLLKVLSGATKAGDFDPNENASIIKSGSIVEINITGFPDHPFHLQCVSTPSSLHIP
jgi:iron transport multicopper oxidase